MFYASGDGLCAPLDAALGRFCRVRDPFLGCRGRTDGRFFDFLDHRVGRRALLRVGLLVRDSSRVGKAQAGDGGDDGLDGEERPLCHGDSLYRRWRCICANSMRSIAFGQFRGREFHFLPFSIS